MTFASKQEKREFIENSLVASIIVFVGVVVSLRTQIF